MPRLPLLLCALALLGSGVSAALFFQIGDSKRILESRLTDAATRQAKLESDLAAANELAGSLKARSEALDARAGALEGELGSTRAKLTSADARAAQLDRDYAQAKVVLGVYEQTARALADEVAALRQDLADARAAEVSPETVAAYKSTIGELERQLADARNGTATLNLPGAATAVFSSRVGRATVLTVGPENAFVVLSFGSNRGAALGQKLSVSQGTEVVATVLISDVRANFSIAQVLPDTLRGVLHKGDPAVLLR